MPRRRRTDYPGAWHHVMNRGIDHGALFADDTDRRIFLTELRDACLHAAVEVHAFCLLTNHFHLLLHAPNAGLSQAMQRFSSGFTQSINRRYARDGPLFRGRFASVPIESDAQLTMATKYIHLNPVEAGLARKPEDWKWSSTGSYLGVTEKPEWLVCAFILSLFAGPDPVAAYRAFLAE